MSAMEPRGTLGGVEEASLEEVLDEFRKALDADQSQDVKPNHAKYVKSTHRDDLDDLILRHFRATQEPTLSVCGQNLPLVYRIISTLVSAPHSMSVFVLDLDGRFDATRLRCDAADLQHVYVQQPDAASATTPDRGRALVAEAEKFMLYSDVARVSSSRLWWGTVVVGGSGFGAGGDLMAGWKGWLRVDRERVPEFGPGTSVEEAYQGRSARQEAVDASGWVATSHWGSITFHE